MNDTAYVVPKVHYTNYPDPNQPTYIGVPGTFEMTQEFVDKTMDTELADKTIRRVLYSKGLMYVLAVDAAKEPTLVVVDPETGEATPDKEGRYLVKANASAYIENGKIGKRIPIFNAKKQLMM